MMLYSQRYIPFYECALKLYTFFICIYSLDFSFEQEIIVNIIMLHNPLAAAHLRYNVLLPATVSYTRTATAR